MYGAVTAIFLSVGARNFPMSSDRCVCSKRPRFGGKYDDTPVLKKLRRLPDLASFESDGAEIPASVALKASASLA